MPSDSAQSTSKHDGACLRRKVEMNFPYLCTCGLTDAQVCVCGNGETEEDRSAVLRCPVHGIGAASDQIQLSSEEANDGS